jgi:starvation-inducible DNA-binding protein
MPTKTSKGASTNGKRADTETNRGPNNHVNDAQPLIDQTSREIQRYGTLRNLPIALSTGARSQSCDLLNQVLADTMILYSLYKKHHWLVAGHTF